MDPSSPSARGAARHRPGPVATFTALAALVGVGGLPAAHAEPPPAAPSGPSADAPAVDGPAAGIAADGESASPPAPVPFDRARLVAEAERLAREPDPDRRMAFEGDYASLGYDAYRDIRFRAEVRPWADEPLPFEVDLLAPGFLFDRPVAIHLVEDGLATEVPFDPGAFEYGPLASTPPNPEALGWSGLRLRHPLNRPDVMDEVAVFQGASYFRAVARDQLYGLSARALAIDTAGPRGEEFPRFVAFWIEKPDADADEVRVHGLLQSRSVTGAYSVRILPGVETRMEVRSTLFPRVDLEHVGIAPLTSMFLFGATDRAGFDDWRDRVHDSDGLQMINGAGERLFRSLANAETLQVSSFVDRDPEAFGLVQRHRAFADYGDAEARYDLRPSAWVEPAGDWGEGRVELVEIPSREEIHDNVVAYWRPAATLRAGSRHDFDYRLSWSARPADAVPLWRVADARAGRSLTDPERRRIVLDFAPPSGVPVPEATIGDAGEAAAPGAAGAPLATLVPSVSASAGEVREVVATALPGGERYRVSFEYAPGEAEAADLRVRLADAGGAPASETWLWRWTP